MEKKHFIKTYKRGNQIIKGHYRKEQKDTFRKGYERAFREVEEEFDNIDKENKEHYWRWNLFGSWLKEKTRKEGKNEM